MMAPSRPTDDDDSVPDERPGQYARLTEIGRGSQSAVWKAIDGFLGREVALKQVLPLLPSRDG